MYGTVTNAGKNVLKLAFINIHTEILIGNRVNVGGLDVKSNIYWQNHAFWCLKGCVCVLHGFSIYTTVYTIQIDDSITIKIQSNYPCLVWDSPSFTVGDTQVFGVMWHVLIFYVCVVRLLVWKLLLSNVMLQNRRTTYKLCICFNDFVMIRLRQTRDTQMEICLIRIWCSTWGRKRGITWMFFCYHFMYKWVMCLGRMINGYNYLRKMYLND